MRGSKIKDFFRTRHPVLDNHFRGLFAADQLKRLRLRNKSFVIINTDRSLQCRQKCVFLPILYFLARRLLGEGKHWYVLARLDDCLELFDPLGIDHETVEQRWGSDHVNQRRLFFNETPVQADWSKKCGEYCCYWVGEAAAGDTCVPTVTFAFTGLRQVSQRRQEVC
jgi:hypothetical protein